MLRGIIEQERAQSVALGERLQDEMAKQHESQKSRASDEQIYELNAVLVLIKKRHLFILLLAKRQRALESKRGA